MRETEAILVPRVCFNRHHMADGVKQYNIETWRSLYTGDTGKEKLCELAQEVTDFYMSQLESENHQVREAACLAVTELYTRVDPGKEAFK
jgi:hypothetical protein